MEVKINTNINVTSKQLVDSMSLGEIGYLLNEVALKFDDDFVDRANLASDFSDNLSETGARFLAEIVTRRHVRTK